MEHSEKFEDSRKLLKLNLQLKCEGICESRGRIQGVYPIYLSSHSALSKKIIMLPHRKNLHRRVASTVAEIRSLFFDTIFAKTD